MTEDKYKIVIIDGTQMFIRYFSADGSLDQFGMPCGGLSGSLKNIRHILKEMNPHEIIVVFDGKDNSKRKQKIDEQYKQGRRMSYVELLPQDNKNLFTKQLRKLLTVLENLPIKLLMMDNIEADDAIGYIIHLYNKLPINSEKIIVSRDGDFKQLLSEDTHIFEPQKRVLYKVKDFKEAEGYSPANFHLFKTFAGEGKERDNVPRILTKKKIMEYFDELLQRDEPVYYTELENYIKANKIEIDLDRVRKNYDLVCLHTPNISNTMKIEINDIVKTYHSKVYGLVSLRTQINLFGIQSHIYADFFDYMNRYKMRNNRFSKYMIESKLAVGVK